MIVHVDRYYNDEREKGIRLAIAKEMLQVKFEIFRARSGVAIVSKMVVVFVRKVACVVLYG